MRSQNIPTAAAETFSDMEAALKHCDEVQFPVVVAADGPASGKV